MATRKAKTSSKKAPAKAKKAKASAIDESRKIKAYAGQEEHFYAGFPRGEAYAILVKAKNRTMTVKQFMDKIEKLPKVKNRKQAAGIVQKLVGKPNEAAPKHRVCAFV